jgi:hypothetical protein
VTALTWKQKDDREQGPVAPASQVEVTVNLKRELLARLPKELEDAALAAVPKGEVPAALALLKHTDPKSRYELVLPARLAHHGQTDQHLILRSWTRGRSSRRRRWWRGRRSIRASTPRRTSSRRRWRRPPGWVASRVLEDAETTLPDGRWVYRLAAEGKMEDLPVVQSFHLVAGPQGDQAVVTFAMKPDQVKAVGGRDRELVNAVSLPKK